MRYLLSILFLITINLSLKAQVTFKKRVKAKILKTTQAKYNQNTLLNKFSDIRRSLIQNMLQKNDSNYYLLSFGTWTLNALFSGNYTRTSDVDLIFAGIDHLERKNIDIHASVSTFIRRNLALGLGFNFSQSNYTLQANIMQNFLRRFIQLGSQSFTFSPFIKNYVPLTQKHALYLTNRTELQYTYKIIAMETPVNQSGGLALPVPGIQQNTLQTLQRKFTTIYAGGISINPGIVLFFTRRFAFEMSIGTMSFGYKLEQLQYVYDKNRPPSAENRKNNTVNRSLDMSFHIDLLKLGIGFAVYL